MLGRARKVFWVALGIAVVAHLAVVGVNPFQQTLEKTPRPLTTRFVKREPRLTKPLELRKLPQPKRQLIRRQVRLAAARMDQVQATAAFDTRHLIGQAAVTSAPAGPRNADGRAEPRAGSDECRHRGQSATDQQDRHEPGDARHQQHGQPGRYRAMVVQDPTNPQTLKGFVKIARVQRELNDTGTHSAQYNNVAMIYLVSGAAAVHRFEGGFPRPLERSRQPFAGGTHYHYHRPYAGFQVGHRAGTGATGPPMSWKGFIFGTLPPTEALEKYGGLVQGRDYYTDRVPEDHPIYNCFFDIGSAPTVSDGYASTGPTRNDLHATWIGNRMVAFTIRPFWVARARLHGRDTTRYMQLAVNTVVYALTQEGSMTQRLMQMVQ